MATTTPNFGWDIPQSTDLVKDGATAIAALGNDIDTSMVDLKGGTTGQVLSKASNTDMDFSWVTDATGIPATIFDAKGDLIAASAADTAARLAVGSNNQVLTADSSTATGLKWATPTASSWTRVANGTLSGSSISITSISAAEILISLSSFSQDTSTRPGIRCNNDSTAGTYGVQNNEDFTEIRMNGSSSTSGEGFCYIVGANSSAIIKMAVANLYPSYIKISSSITSVQIISGGTFTGGTYEVWTR